MQDETWNGAVMTPDAAAGVFGADQVYPFSEVLPINRATILQLLHLLGTSTTSSHIHGVIHLVGSKEMEPAHPPWRVVAPHTWASCTAGLVVRFLTEDAMPSASRSLRVHSKLRKGLFSGLVRSHDSATEPSCTPYGTAARPGIYI